MDKRIEFLIKVDSSEFDRAVEQMQRKLKDVYRPADLLANQRQTTQRLEGLGLGGGMSKPAMDAVLKSIGTARTEIGKILKEQQHLQNESLKTLQAHVAKEKELITLREAAKKGSKEELDTLQKIEAVRKNIHNEEVQFKARAKSMSQGANAYQGMGEDIVNTMAQGLGGGQGGGGPQSGAAAAGSMIANSVARILPSLLKGGAIGVALGAVISEGQQYASIPSKVRQAQGATAQGLFGTPLSSIAGGQLPEDILYGQQTQEANQSAKVGEMGRRWADLAKLTVGWSSVKALFGSEDPDAELARGALLPGQLGDAHLRKYEADQAQRTQDDILATRKSLEMNDPLRKQGLEDFQQNYMRDLQFQRSTGLDYGSFHGPGGFKDQMANAGFTPEMGMEASQGILAAGGSTQGAQGNAGLSLQAQRGYGLTNANQNIGALSGLMGDSESTRQAYVRLITQGTRAGYDTSQNREEFRRFMDIQTQAVTQSGTRSQMDVDMIAERVSGFLSGDKTVRGQTAGQSAYQSYSNAVSQTQGPQGAMRAGAMLQDKVLSQIAGPDLANLYGVDLPHLTTDNPVVNDIYNKYKGKIPGLTKKDIVSRAVSAGQKSFFQTAKGDQLVKRQKELNAKLSTTTDPKMRKNIQAELEQVIDSTAAEIHRQTGEQDTVKLRQEARGLAGGAATRQKTINDMSDTEKKLGDKGAGVFEDKQVQALAEQSKLMIHAFQRLHTTFVPLTKEVGDYTTQLERQAIAYANLKTPAERAAYLAKPENKQIANLVKKQDQKQ